MEIPQAAVTAIDAAINFVYSFQPLAEKTVVLGKKRNDENRYAFPL